MEFVRKLGVKPVSTLPRINLLREYETVAATPAASTSARRIRFSGPLIMDVAMLCLAGLAVSAASLVGGATGPPVGWVVAFSGLTLVLLANRGMYIERGLLPHRLDQARTVLSATAVATMAVITLRLILADNPHAARELVEAWLFGTTFLMAGRIALYRSRHLHTLAHGGRPTLIVGAGKVGHRLARRLIQRREFGLQPVGFVDDDPLDIGDEAVALPVLGANWHLDQVIADHEIEHVIFTFSTAPHDVLLKMMRRCNELGVMVSHVPRLFEAASERVTVEHVGGLPIMTMRRANPRGWQFLAKYAIDRVVSALILLALAPLIAVIALGVKIAIGGPVLFRQKRVGLDGREFEMLKFRTMKGSPEASGESDADWAAEIMRMAAASNGNGNGSGNGNGRPSTNRASVAGGEDRRTRCGSFLRKFSLDELPQLWNVLRGDMSLIGPRPERVSYVHRFEHAVHRYHDRHRVKSGITGWAQVHGLRGQTSLLDRVEWDNYYIENWSLWLDLKVALLTGATLFRYRAE